MSCCGQCGAGPGCPDDVRCAACSPCGDPDGALGFKKRVPGVRGDTLVVVFENVVDPVTQAPIDLGAMGSKAWFTVKDYLVRADSQAAWQGTLAAGVVQDYPGHVTVTVPADKTALWPDGVQKLYYDFQVLSAGKVTTIERGLIVLGPDVTLTRS